MNTAANSTLSLNVSFRPLRIGLLINEGSHKGLRAAISLNTALWGGLLNPILPVGPTSHRTSEVMGAFQLDRLYPVEGGEAIERLVVEHAHLNTRYQWLEPVVAERRIRVQDVVPALAEMDDRRRTGAFRHTAVLPIWLRNDPLDLVLASLFGVYPDPLQVEPDLAAYYQIAFGCEPTQIGVGEEIPFGQTRSVIPLGMTVYKLESSRRWLAPPYQFMAIDPTSVEQIALFWNLRAAGCHLVPIPIPHTERFGVVIHEQLEAVRSDPLRPATSVDHVLVPQGIEAESEIVAALGRSEGLLQINNSHDFLAGVLEEHGVVHMFTREHEVLAHQQVVGPDGPTIHFAVPPPPFPRGTPRVFRQAIAVVVRSPVEGGIGGFTLHTLDVPELYDWYRRRIAGGIDPVRPETSGFALISTIDEGSRRVSPVDTSALVDRLFQSAGFQVTRSPAGVVSSRVVLDLEIEGCRVFKVPGVRRLLAEGLGPTGEHAKKIQDYIHQGLKPFERLVIEHGQKPPLTPQQVLDYLVRHKMVRPGLKLKCGHCQLDLWASLKALDESVECTFCGRAIPVASEIARTRGVWHYRFSGVYERPKKQDGFATVVLSLLQLHRVRHHDRGRLAYALGMILRVGREEGEVDCVAVDRDPNLRPVVLLGECKSEGGAFETAKIAQMYWIGSVLAARGWRTYLMFSTLSSGFREGELDAFRLVRAAGLGPILFTRRELELYEPYEDAESEGLPNKHVFDFEGFARNSIARYLG